jgi:hypothetical protein
MKPDELSRKSQGILEALAEGHSCHQILEWDQTLTFHDIFRAVGEVPTSYWNKNPATGTEWLRCAKPIQTLTRHRID